jgi:hypothetical protein
MAQSAKIAGVGLDLQALHACGADCGGANADAWLAHRPGRQLPGMGTVYDRVRALHIRLGRRVRIEDIASVATGAAAEEADSAQAVAVRELRRVAATPPTLPPGPAPLPVVAPAPAAPLLARVRRPRCPSKPVPVRLPLPAVRTPAGRQRMLRDLRRWQLRVRALKALLAEWERA